jgi:hypothetical protein
MEVGVMYSTKAESLSFLLVAELFASLVLGKK